MTMSTPDHITRAQALHTELAPVAAALEQRGVTVTLEILHDRTLAAVVLSATFPGSPAQANKLARHLEGAARSRGYDLRGHVLDRLQPDQARVAFVYSCQARKAAA